MFFFELFKTVLLLRFSLSYILTKWFWKNYETREYCIYVIFCDIWSYFATQKFLLLYFHKNVLKKLSKQEGLYWNWLSCSFKLFFTQVFCSCIFMKHIYEILKRVFSKLKLFCALGFSVLINSWNLFKESLKTKITYRNCFSRNLFCYSHFLFVCICIDFFWKSH